MWDGGLNNILFSRRIRKGKCYWVNNYEKWVDILDMEYVYHRRNNMYNVARNVSLSMYKLYSFLLSSILVLLPIRVIETMFE